MPDFWQEEFQAELAASLTTRRSRDRGTRFEDLICRMFESLDGVSLIARNTYNAAGSQEIDISFWNDRSRSSLIFLPDAILVECKNWSKPVSSAEVAWFDAKVRQRGLDFGVLFAARGITGDRRDRSFAHHIIEFAQSEKRKLVVVTSAELATISSSDEFVALLHRKLGQLLTSQTSLT